MKQISGVSYVAEPLVSVNTSLRESTVRLGEERGKNTKEGVLTVSILTIFRQRRGGGVVLMKMGK